MRIVTVSELTNYIKSKFENDAILRNIWVKGEISNFRHHSSGHMYLTLKDEGAALKAVMFKSRNSQLPFRPDNGMGVLARGYLSLFERDGQYQLYVDEMQPDGIGALHMAFTQLKSRLEMEGLFASATKKKLPSLPRKVAVITSPTGAAVRDIITVMQRRLPHTHIILMPVAVQGDEAPGQIARGIEMINSLKDIDVIIVGRGGGSLEELWAFNTEIVARSIFASRIPVVSAVGHETDYTIADFVSDHRAPTPSAAAEVVVPDRKELVRHINSLRDRLNCAITTKLDNATYRLRTCLDRVPFTRPKEKIFRSGQELDYLTKRLGQSIVVQLQDRKHKLALQLTKMNALSPLGTLARGYGICRTGPEGRLISGIKQVEQGQNIQVILQDGFMDCTVLRKGEGNNGEVL